jgi:hypothetical protein
MKLTLPVSIISLIASTREFVNPNSIPRRGIAMYCNGSVGKSPKCTKNVPRCDVKRNSLTFTGRIGRICELI